MTRAKFQAIASTAIKANKAVTKIAAAVAAPLKLKPPTNVPASTTPSVIAAIGTTPYLVGKNAKLLAPTMIMHYRQIITFRDSRNCIPKRNTIHERHPGIHASGVINVLARRESSIGADLDEKIPTRMEQGQAVEARYFGYPWHRNTAWQPQPYLEQGISGSPDGITGTFCPVLQARLAEAGVTTSDFQLRLLEEFKSTYYSEKKAKSWDQFCRNFRTWLWQMAIYLYMIMQEDINNGSFIPGKPYLSRITVWWVMGDYTFKDDSESPMVTAFIMAWTPEELDHFWNNRVLTAAKLAKHD